MNPQESELPNTHLVTDDVRLSFPALFAMKPRARGSDKESFQATILLPPGTDMKPYHAAIKAAMIAKWGKVIKLPAAKNPIKDAGEKDYAGYDEGWFSIAMNNPFNQPPVVDRMGTPVTDESKVYAGMWVKVYCNAFAWQHDTGGQGVSFSVNAVQLVRDDERLDGRRDPTSVFAPLGKAEGDDGDDGDDGEDLFA